MKPINLGKGHTIVAERIISIIQYGSRPTIRLRQQFEKKNTAINLSGGDKVRTLILMDEGWLFMSSVKAETITERLGKSIE